MKQVFLITAYNDFEWLKKTLCVYSEYVDCFVHIDKKSTVPKEFINWANQKKGVYIFKKYKINWGSYQHISAILYLIRKAIQTDNYDYFHILSGNSFITRPMREVLEFFENSPETNFIQMDDLDVIDKDGTIDPWFIYYHFLSIYNKKTKLGNNIDYYFVKIQNRLGIRRKTRYKYHGLFYSHLTRSFIDYALDYAKKNPNYFRNLKTCNISEEFFFHNIIMNSPYETTVHNNHLFYNKWNNRGVAEFLTKSDYNILMSNNYLFARKFGMESIELFEEICSKITE